MISVGTLNKKEAKEKYGITMHARKNGEAGIKVWLAFKEKDWESKFTYAELRIEDEKGEHLLSTELKPNPIHHQQSPEVTTLVFSARQDQLKNCKFFVVMHQGLRTGVGYYLPVKDFLDLDNPITED